LARTLQEQKHELRRRCAARRRALARSASAGAGRAVADALLACPAVKDARRIALYASLDDELPTRPVFESLAGPERTLAFPCAASGGGLAFAVAASWEMLRPGDWGVLAPGEGARRLALDEIEVALVPGVAFDVEGNRLGRGGGHYDATFPADRPAPILIGLAWSFQLVDAVPHGSRDRRVDAIVTERGCVAKPGRRK
jgi:5-formyltetrahydrofolate cyclo-ligase